DSRRAFKRTTGTTRIAPTGRDFLGVEDETFWSRDGYLRSEPIRRNCTVGQRSTNDVAFLCSLSRTSSMPKKNQPTTNRGNANHKRLRIPQAGSRSTRHQRNYTIPDYRLEKPSFELRQVRDGDTIRYEVSGKLNSSVPPIRDSKYLSKQQCIEIYRWMLLNRKMETALENLYKQGKVVGGVYFGLGQEACSCASAYALQEDEWLGPLIRDQGALCVRGFSAADIMMQYMAKAGSPTKGRDASSHFGDIQNRNVVAPISTLGDLIPR